MDEQFELLGRLATIEEDKTKQNILLKVIDLLDDLRTIDLSEEAEFLSIHSQIEALLGFVPEQAQKAILEISVNTLINRIRKRIDLYNAG